MKNNPMSKRELDELVKDVRNFKNLINDFIRHEKMKKGEAYFDANYILTGIVKLYRKYILKKKGVIKFYGK